jgi:hypothetical protein
MDRPVVEVAADPVPFDLACGVGPLEEVVRCSSRSCRNWRRERIVWSATLAAVTSRMSRRVPGGSVGMDEDRASRYPVPRSVRTVACPVSGRGASVPTGSPVAAAISRHVRRKTSSAFRPTIEQTLLRLGDRAAFVQLDDPVRGGVEDPTLPVLRTGQVLGDLQVRVKGLLTVPEGVTQPTAGRRSHRHQYRCDEGLA